jgi:peptidoglycan/LPS O-acetylase OafA/YrhL
MTYLPFIDGLRAVAILAVVAFHAWPALVPGGFAGVDVFFVISGFLITRFIVAEMADGTFSLGRFFVRRARRLMPAALVCFASIAALSALVLLPDAYWYFGRSLLSAVLMYANIFFYRTGGYFSAPSLEKPLLHTWSLAVEDQFYLTWPLLLLVLLPRVSRNALCGIALVFCAASFVFAEFKMVRDPDFAFFQLPTRAWELLTGAALALNASRLVFSQATANALAATGMGAILLSFSFLAPGAHFPGVGALPACLGTAAIIASSLNQNSLVAHALARPPVVFTGLISYSLYLWHWPLIALASYRLERPLTAVEAAAVIAVSAVIAFLSWRYVERPFRASHTATTARVLTGADRRFAFGATLGVALMASVAFCLKIEKGFPQRYEASVRTLLEQMVTPSATRGQCDGFENVFANDGTCNFGRKKAAGESYEVAIFGDSMADQWSPLIAKFSVEHKLAGRQVTNSGCPMLRDPSKLGMAPDDCKDYQREAEKFVTANPNLKLAIISGFWEGWLWRTENPHLQYSEGMALQSTLAQTTIKATPRFDAALNETIQFFTGRGIKVMLLGQTPRYLALPLRCVVSNIARGHEASACGKPAAAARQELVLSNSALGKAARENPQVTLSLPIDYICAGDNCLLMLKDTFLYKNGGHINPLGALVFGDFVRFPELK